MGLLPTVTVKPFPPDQGLVRSPSTLANVDQIMATPDHSRLPRSKSSTAKALPLNRLPARPFELQAKPETTEKSTQTQGDRAKPFGFDITTMPLIQAKLTIGEPGDKYEQEADRVASEVVQRINTPQAAQSGSGQRRSQLTTDSVQAKPAISTIQRQEIPKDDEEIQAKPLVQREEIPQEEEEELVQSKPLVQREEMPQEEEELVQSKSLAQREEMPQEEEEELVQSKSLVQREEMSQEEEELVQSKSLAQREEMPQEEEELVQSKSSLQRQVTSGAAPTNIESSIDQARGSGQPLQEDIRSSMETAFGADFGGVNVHTDARSDQLNQSIQARAFTTGKDIFFRQGEYQPGSRNGQELLAHELTHVVQQGGAGSLQKSSLAQKDAQSENSIQKDGGITAGVGLALSAAGFVASTRPSGTDAFGNTNVQFRYSRNENGPHRPRNKTRMILRMRSIKGFGLSYAHLGLVLRYDGHNIISAYTQQSTVSGYSGGMIGSEANVSFSAVECSQPDAPITEAYVLFQGFNNPSGPGFQRFRGKLLVTGDGRIEPLECELTAGSGHGRVKGSLCEVGWE